MSSDEEYGGGGDMAALSDSFTADLETMGVDPEDDESISIRDDNNRPRCSAEECSEYKHGVCELEVCPKVHSVLQYPSNSHHWTKKHVDSLRLDFVPLGVDNYVTSVVLKEWLVTRSSRADSIHGDGQVGLVLAATLAAWDGGKVDYDGLSRHLECEGADMLFCQDPFIDNLTKFWLHNDLKMENERTLNLSAQATCSGESLLVLYRWIQVLKSPKVTECLLDDLLVEMIRTASQHTDTPLLINIRESTRRSMRINGEDVMIQNNVEALGTCINDNSVLHITNCVEKISSNKVIWKKDCGYAGDNVEHFLPQIACKALAIGEDSSFGTDLYKTVYQLSLHVVQDKMGRLVDSYLILSRCHISRSTLECMSEQPISNPLQRSVLMYQRVNFGDIDKDAMTVLYLAIKAVIIMFKRRLKE